MAERFVDVPAAGSSVAHLPGLDAPGELAALTTDFLALLPRRS